MFQNFTDISGTVDNTKDKTIRFGNLVNDSEFILDDLRASGKVLFDPLLKFLQHLIGGPVFSFGHTFIALSYHLQHRQSFQQIFKS